MEPPPPESQEPGAQDLTARRWRLIRDLAVFVVKVGLEAVRDVLLIPVALGAGLLGLLFSPSRPDRFFAAVLRLGDRFDGFVDLFGSAEARRRAGISGEQDERRLRADALFDRLEETLREQHARGGVTSQAKETIDRALDSFQSVLPDARADRRDPTDTSPLRSDKGATPGDP